MKKLKMGTPLMGLAIGAALVAIAALIMIIGFWKVLILVLLFGIGFFIGTVDNKQEFIKDAANKIIPAKEAKVIDIKSEIARDLDSRQAAEVQAAIEELQADSENGLFLDMYKTLMRLAYQRKIKDLRKWSEQMAAMGREKQKRWLSYFLRMTRENFVYNFQKEELNYMTSEEEAFARNFARFVNEGNILPISDMANLAIRDIGQNANAKIVFFDLALQMIVLLLQKS